MTTNNTKEVKIGFYHGVTAKSENENISSIGDVLELIENGSLPSPNIPISLATSREIREVQRSSHFSGFVGVFAKFQHSDIPTIAVPSGEERDIDMSDDEGLLEKLYFLYIPEFDILVCRLTGTAAPLGSYLSAAFAPNFANKAIVFSPIIQTSAWERLMAEDALIQSFKMKIARPTNPELLPDDPWSKSLLGMFSSSEGAVITVKMAAELRKTTRLR